jgi:tight adherence protein B
MGTDVIIFIGMVFFAVFLLVTSLVVPTFGTAASNARLIRKRAKDSSFALQEGDLSILKNIRKKNLSDLEKYFNRFKIIELVDNFIQQTGVEITAYKLVMMNIVASVFLAIILFSYTEFALLSFLALLLPPFLSWVYIRQQFNKRLALFEEQLPDALNIIARALRAGHPFNASLKLVAEEMPDPIGGELKVVSSDIAFGIDTRVALLELVKRIPSVSLNAMVTAVSIQRETGGNLAEILDKVANVIRSRFKFSRKVKTLSAEGRMSAWVLSLVPFILALVLVIVEPTYLPFLTKEPLGRKLILAGFILLVLGMLWMRKIIKIQV